MILLLDTSTAVCLLTLVDADNTFELEWQADRQLAKGLLKFIVESLEKHSLKVNDLDGMVVMKGPGSFTGLRIGSTVLNTIAEFEDIPIVGVTGDSWKNDGLERLKNHENDQIVIPDYGRPARITTPRK